MASTLVKTDTLYIQLNNNGTFHATIQESGYTPNVMQSSFNANGDVNYVNNQEIQAGELGIVVKNALSDIDIFVEPLTGELFVSGKDAHNYSIDSNGNLVYTWK